MFPSSNHGSPLFSGGTRVLAIVVQAKFNRYSTIITGKVAVPYYRLPPTVHEYYLQIICMSFAPRSRTPSRSGTPGPVPARTPSRLVVPHTLRPTHSLSNLHVHSHSSPTQVPPLPIQPSNHELDSSASSVVDTDGILIQGVDAEVDTVEGDDGNAVGYVAAGEGSKKNLRDQLRQTLNKRQPSAGEEQNMAIFDNQDVLLINDNKIFHRNALCTWEDTLMSMRYLMTLVSDALFFYTISIMRYFLDQSFSFPPTRVFCAHRCRETSVYKVSYL